MSKFIDKMKSLKSTIHNLNNEFEQIQSDTIDRNSTDKSKEYKIRRAYKENLPIGNPHQKLYKSTRNNESRTAKIDFNILTPNVKQNSMINQHVENYMKHNLFSNQDFDKIKEADNDYNLMYNGKNERRKLNFESADESQIDTQLAKRVLPSECIPSSNAIPNLIQFYLRESTITPVEK